MNIQRDEIVPNLDKYSIMKHSDRPLDMLHRQLQANRAAIKYRNPETKRRHFCHLPLFKQAFLTDIKLLREAIREKTISHHSHLL